MNCWIFKLAVFVVTMSIGVVSSALFNFDYKARVIDHERIDHHERHVHISEETPVTRPPNQDLALDPSSSEEVFSDETQVGRPGKNKVSIRCFEEGSKAFAEIKFFWLSHGTREWKQQQLTIIEKDSSAICNPQIKDFNNDGFGDVTIGSKVAARGANEVRTLLLYRTDHRSAPWGFLDEIENSAEVPNLEYNGALDCITAWAFHGATTTIFLKVEGRRLREFASVDTGEERVVTIIRRNGQRVVVSRDKMNEQDIYTRYSTFNPPR